jgi:hypothetical protein
MNRGAWESTAATARGFVAQARLGLISSRLEPRLTWILGSPRSGTTWLGALIASATGTPLLDEPLIGAHLAVPVATVISVAGADPLLYEANASRSHYFFSTQAAASWQPGLRRLLLRRFAGAVIASGAKSSSGLVIKEPNGSLAAPLLMRVVPRSRLLFVVRDGRDVVDSIVDGATDGWITEVHGAAVDDEARETFIIGRANHWVRAVNAVETAYAAHEPARRFRVTYEALLAEPVVELERIMTWLGRADAIPALPQLVDQLSFDKLPPDQTGPGRFARAATPGLWREHFSATEQELLAQIMGSTLVSLGYE